MKIRLEWLFMGVVGIVAVAVLVAWQAPTGDFDMAGQFAPPASVESPVSPAATAEVRQSIVSDAQAAAVPPADGLQVPMIATEAERTGTLDQRKAALPVFLAAAAESIATLQSDIERAKTNGTDAAEIAEMEARLRTMQRVREQVLARNDDIR